MRGLMMFAAVLIFANAVNGEYHRPSCGTATVCGAPIHDFLHRII